MTTGIEKRSAFGNQQTKRRAIYLLIGLLVINGLAWVWAFTEFNDNAVLMGMAFLAY
ncbi:HoxN/HupN/NixA family nickel/cobalt transporter, partial [Yersinia enterocolitica]